MRELKVPSISNEFKTIQKHDNNIKKVQESNSNENIIKAAVVQKTSLKYPFLLLTIYNKLRGTFKNCKLIPKLSNQKILLRHLYKREKMPYLLYTKQIL